MPDVNFKFTADDEATPVISKLKDTMKELASGIGYQIGAWNVGFMLANKLVDETVSDFQTLFHISGRLGGSLGEASSAFAQIAQAASVSHASIAETFKTASDFYSVGLPHEEALAATIATQNTLWKTGIDLRKSAAAAATFQATPQQILQASEAGGPFAPLAGPARAEIQRQSMRELAGFQFQLQQTVAERELQDETHNKEHLMELNTMVAARDMDDRQRVESQSLEDMHFRINDEIEQTDRMINREMEMRHRAIQEEMEDRHRAAQEAEDDADHAISNEEYGINRVKQARSLALREREMGGWKESKFDRKARMYEELQEDKQLFELEGQAHDLREKRRLADRAMEHETIRETRREYHQSFDEAVRQQNERHAQAVSFHWQDVDMSRDHDAQRRDFEWSHAAQRMELSDDVYEKNRDLERKGQDFRTWQEGQGLMNRYDLNRQFQKSLDESIKAAPSMYPTQQWNPITGTTFGLGKAPITGGVGAFGGGGGEGAATETTLQDVKDLLQRVLGD